MKRPNRVKEFYKQYPIVGCVLTVFVVLLSIPGLVMLFWILMYIITGEVPIPHPT